MYVLVLASNILISIQNHDWISKIFIESFILLRTWRNVPSSNWIYGLSSIKEIATNNHYLLYPIFYFIDDHQLCFSLLLLFNLDLSLTILLVHWSCVISSFSSQLIFNQYKVIYPSIIIIIIFFHLSSLLLLFIRYPHYIMIIILIDVLLFSHLSLPLLELPVVLVIHWLVVDCLRDFFYISSTPLWVLSSIEISFAL